MNDIFETFDLTEGEKLHPLWMRLRAHLEKQLQIKRARNDAAQTEMETAILRGHIQALKALIALGDDRPQTTGD